MRTKPKKEIDLQRVEQLAAQGLSMEKIALALGVSSPTIYQRKRENKDFLEAIKRGQAKGLEQVTNKLWEAVQDGKAWAICFYLKCKGEGEWRETKGLDLTSSDGSMSPKGADDKFNLAQLSPEQIRALRGVVDDSKQEGPEARG